MSGNLYLYLNEFMNTCEALFNVLLFINIRGSNESIVISVKFAGIIEIPTSGHYKNTLLLTKKIEVVG